MYPILFASFGHILLQLLLGGIALFLILLVLVQRGRGGGLAGALGGAGGSSAFGAKAGDVFTKITAVAAGIWMVLCLAATVWAPQGGSRFGDAATGGDRPAMSATINADKETPADEEAPAGETGAPESPAPESE